MINPGYIVGLIKNHIISIQRLLYEQDNRVIKIVISQKRFENNSVTMMKIFFIRYSTS